MSALLALVVIAVLAVDGVSASVARPRLEEIARQAAAAAAEQVLAHGDLARARAVALDVAAEHDADLQGFTVDQRGVGVTVGRDVFAFVLDHFPPTDDWYRIEETVFVRGG